MPPRPLSGRSVSSTGHVTGNTPQQAREPECSQCSRRGVCRALFAIVLSLRGQRDCNASAMRLSATVTDLCRRSVWCASVTASSLSSAPSYWRECRRHTVPWRGTFGSTSDLVPFRNVACRQSPPAWPLQRAHLGLPYLDDRLRVAGG